MKIPAVGFSILISLTLLTGCKTSETRQGEHRTAGEVAGQAAYDIQKGAKKAAKEVSKELKTFGHDAKEGFQQEKAKDQSRKQPEK